MPEFPRDLERRLLRELLVSGNVKSQLEPEHVVASGEPAADEVTELRRGRPFPRSLLDVAVREHEPARHLGQRVDGRVRVLGRLQPVRPVDGRRHARVDRLEGGEQVACIHVLRPEPLAGLQVVPDEVLRQRPVGAVAAHRGLPHVTVRVDHARHHDATGRVDLQRPLGHLQLRPDRRDVLPGDQHVGAGQHSMRVVHGQDGAVPEDDRASGGQFFGGQLCISQRTTSSTRRRAL